MDSLDSAKWEMVEAGGRTAQSFGLTRLFGQLYMFLYLSPEARSLDEIAQGLGVSKASISITCRQLESWGALRRVWKRGDRKDYYEAEIEFGRIVNNGIKSSFQKKLDSAKLQIEQSLAYLDGAGEDNQERQVMQQRLKHAEQYRSKIEKVVNNPIIGKLLKL
ncbi:MAG: hypothetical protein EOM12_14790 [Verrucomicrobiae bacterium]|nr:hypothetical protein [Verrucomicrobiae bacterium]